MTTKTDITLPPLPGGLALQKVSMRGPVGIGEAMQAYARDAIEADRKRQGEVVVTKTPEGEIIAVTRQDDEGRILSVIAEADRQRGGEPYKLQRPHIGQQCNDIWRRFKESHAWGDLTEFPHGKGHIYTIKPGINFGAFVADLTEHIIEQIEQVNPPLYTAPQPAEPVKVPSDDEILAWAGEEQFFLFADPEEVLDIVKSALQHFGQPKPSNSGELEPAASAQPVVNQQMTTAASDVLADTQRAIIEAAERRGYELAIAECAQDREDAAAWLDKLISLVVTYGDCRHFEVEATDKRDAADRSAQAFAKIMAHARAAKEQS